MTNKEQIMDIKEQAQALLELLNEYPASNHITKQFLTYAINNLKTAELKCED